MRPGKTATGAREPGSLDRWTPVTSELHQHISSRSTMSSWLLEIYIWFWVYPVENDKNQSSCEEDPVESNDVDSGGDSSQCISVVVRVYKQGQPSLPTLLSQLCHDLCSTSTRRTRPAFNKTKWNIMENRKIQGKTMQNSSSKATYCYITIDLPSEAKAALFGGSLKQISQRVLTELRVGFWWDPAITVLMKYIHSITLP